MTNALALVSDTTRGLTDGRPPAGFHFIYFYGTEEGNEVKIGKTRQAVFQRRQQHENQNGHDVPMRTLAVVLGHAADERAVLRHFKPYLSRERSPEWFHAPRGGPVRDYLRWLRGCPFVATREDEMHQLTAVDSSAWLPDTGRRREQVQLRIVEEDAWDDLNVDHVMEGDFYTHPAVTDAARTAMGRIDLDPASCRQANAVVGAANYYGFHDNGLLHPWHGCVWANPPFGAWNEWGPKIVDEWNSGRIEQMCVLIPTRATTAKSLGPLVASASAVMVPRGRLPFWGPKATSSPDEGHFIFYFGANTTSFADAFSGIGTTFTEVR